MFSTFIFHMKKLPGTIDNIGGITGIIILFILILLSCSSHRNSGKKIFRYNDASGISSLDPAFAKTSL